MPNYPAEIKDVDYQLMLSDYDGFSDHTMGIEASKRALEGGTKVIEKHFVIDRHTGVDATWGMTPEELRELVRYANSNNPSKVGVS